MGCTRIDHVYAYLNLLYSCHSSPTILAPEGVILLAGRRPQAALAEAAVLAEEAAPQTALCRYCRASYSSRGV